MKKILLTGATGYIGKRLLPILIEGGYFVICCVRDKNKFHVLDSLKNKIQVIEVDLTRRETLHDCAKMVKDPMSTYWYI